MTNDRQLKDMTAIYIEDDEFTREMMLKVLGIHFGRVLGAADGRSGLDVISAEKPDIVITDLAMPEMDGFEMIKALEEIGYTGPVIATTAYREEAERLRVDKHVSAIVFKPVERGAMMQAIEKALG